MPASVLSSNVQAEQQKLQRLRLTSAMRLSLSVSSVLGLELTCNAGTDNIDHTNRQSLPCCTVTDEQEGEDKT